MKKKLPCPAKAFIDTFLFCLIVAYSLFSINAGAQSVPLDTLFAPVPCPFCAFGFNLSAATDRSGALRLLTNERYRPPDGAAYVFSFEPASGGFVAEDSLGSVSPNGGLGHAVALADGSTPPFAALSNGGDVVVWRRGLAGEWEVERRFLQPSKPGGRDPTYGSALAGSFLGSGEEILVVGAQNGGDLPGSVLGEGSVYFYRRPPGGSWQGEGRRVPPDGEEGDQFGTAVALLPTPGGVSGHPGDALVLVGANLHPRTQGQDGAAYVYTRNGTARIWSFTGAITPADLQDFDYFGSALALLAFPGGQPGEVLALIGASGEDERATRAGAAYVFRREATAPGVFEWVEEAKLYPDRPGLGLAFGAAVALAADTLTSGTPVALALVGSDPSGESGSFPSEASLFVRTVDVDGAVTWTRRATYVTGAEGPLAADWFGHSVAFAQTPGGPLALVGAYYSNAAEEQGFPDGEGAGAVFVYDGRATVAVEPPALPTETEGLRISPNPARDRASVAVSLGAPASVRVAVYDVLGRRVAVLHDGPLAAGEHVLAWDTQRVSPGVYVIRAEGASFGFTRTVTVVR